MLTHDSRFLRGAGDGVALGLGVDALIAGEVIDVLVVLEDLRGDVMPPQMEGVSGRVDAPSEEVLLRASLRGRDGGARERHASAAAVGNEIRCGWDAREPPGARSEEGAIVTDIGRARRGAVAVVAGGGGERTASPAF
jgi:hypothetical protein